MADVSGIDASISKKSRFERKQAQHQVRGRADLEYASAFQPECLGRSTGRFADRFLQGKQLLLANQRSQPGGT